MTDLILYSHPFSSYCQKAIVAFYEKGLPFTQRMLEDEGAMDELRALWPFGQFPVLKDGDRRFAETSIIIERLDQIAPATPMIPTDPDLALEARFMDRVFDNHVQAHQQRIIYNALRPEDQRAAKTDADARKALETTYAWLNDLMADRTWAAGEAFTIADCGAAPRSTLCPLDPSDPGGPGAPVVLSSPASGATLLCSGAGRGAALPGLFPTRCTPRGLG